jgi:DNA-binding MarR family transcriptional regulator
VSPTERSAPPTGTPRSKASPKQNGTSVSLEGQPGHLIRRLQQIAVAIFLQETEPFSVTPVQYAALHAVGCQPDLDQRTLARTIGLDTSTVAGVVDRLQSRGLMERNGSPQDRRVRLLTLTQRGHEVLAAIEPSMLAAQDRMLGPLSPADRQEFMRMLRLLVKANNDFSRAPGEG